MTIKIINSFFSNFFEKKRGSATGISLGFSAGVLAVSLGAVSIVSTTVETNKNVENSTISYFSAERGIEYSLLDVSGHLAGYEVSKDGANSNLQDSHQESKTQIDIKSLSTEEKNETPNQIMIPFKGGGTDTDNNSWNSLKKGSSFSIPLYTDNTTK